MSCVHPDVYPETARLRTQQYTKADPVLREDRRAQIISHRCRATPVADVLKYQDVARAELQPTGEQGRALLSELPTVSAYGQGGGDQAK